MFTRRILELLYEDDEELERLEHIRHINELLDSETIPRYDAAMKPGLSPLVRATAVMRQLAYGIGADTADEYLPVAESTALSCSTPENATGDFLECLAPLTVCIGNGTIALLLGMVLTQVAQSMQAQF
ncbi:hypothetical protein O0I10_003454, partial [Lichtheimia ornata]